MSHADSADNATEGKDHTGLGPLRIPIFIGGTIFAYYEAIKSWGRFLAGEPTEIFAKANDTLIQNHAGFSPNLFQEVIFGSLMTIAAIVFSIGDVFMFAHYLGYPKSKDESHEVSVEIGRCASDTIWATYYYPSKIVIQGGQDDDASDTTKFCRAIIGIDHEYLHHVLFTFVSKEASVGFDRLAKTLTDHAQWTGMNMSFEARTDGFWKKVDP